MKVHEIKIEQMFFDRNISGSKSCEVRKNDRDYQVGDRIIFITPNGEIHNRKLFEVTHLLPGGEFGIEAGWCVLSIKPIF